MEKRVRRLEGGIKEDRISELPQDLRHQIMYYLPTKEAAATAVLSSLWRDAWLTLPWLRLNENFFSEILHNHPGLSHSHEQIIKFIAVHIFNRRRAHQYHDKVMLKELLLHLPRLSLVSGDKIPESAVCQLNQFLVWVVIEFQVKKLDFSIGYEDNNFTRQPSELYGGIRNNFISSTLAYRKQQAVISDLSLRGCILNFCLKTKGSTLRILSLRHVKLLDQQVLDSVTAHCRLIESLSLAFCSGEFDTLNALCLKKLVTLSIHDPYNCFKKIQIDAPNLETLYTSQKLGSCIIHDLAISKCLKSLRITGNATITDEWLDHISIANLSKLKELRLDDCPNVKRFRISSRSLDTIQLSSHELQELKIVDAPRLLNLNFWYTCQSPPTSSFMLSGASASTKAGIWLQEHNHIHNRDVNYALKYEKLVKFLSIFNVLRKLKVTFQGIVVVPLNIRKLLNPPLVVKDQKLIYVVHLPMNQPTHHRLMKAIDGLLWLSACGPKTITIHLGRKVSKRFEFEYKEDDNTTEKCGYCESLPVRCWRHCLHEVTIKNQGVKKSLRSVKRDAELEEFFKTATNPRNVVVNIIYCDYPNKLFRLVARFRETERVMFECYVAMFLGPVYCRHKWDLA